MTTDYPDMVQTVVRDLQRRGFGQLQAASGDDFPTPDGYFQVSSQKWFIPDVQARSGSGQLFIYEVETEESLQKEESKEKIRVLANAAAKANGHFYLVVPERLRDGARRLLNDLHVDWGEVLGLGETGTA